MNDDDKAIVTEIAKQVAQQVAQQAAEAAAAQAASQVAQQTAQQAAEAISQAVSKLMQTQSQTTGATMVAGREELGDIGGTERLEKDQMSDSGQLFNKQMNDGGLLYANMKRTYDEFQHESLEAIRRNRAYVEKVIFDAQQNDNLRQNIANQALQNAVETANMVSKLNLRHSENAVETANFTAKQASRHSDIAIDRQWNVDEQGYTAADMVKAVSGDTNVQKALADLLTKVVGDAIQQSVK